MFTVFRLFILPWLIFRYTVFRLTRTGPFGPGRARYVDPDVPAGASPLKQALWETHVKQYHEASCSVASVVNIINAVHRYLGSPGAGSLTQAEILETVRAAFWKERMQPQGHNGHRGLPLPVLAEVVTESLRVYGIRYSCLDVVQASANPSAAKRLKRELRARLLEFETSGRCLILIHFNQGILVPEYQIPHISPVGGYDPAKDMVTLLDVDPDQTMPYEVGFDRFYESLANDYGWLFRLKGFGSGGYVYIRLP